MELDAVHPDPGDGRQRRAARRPAARRARARDRGRGSSTNFATTADGRATIDGSTRAIGDDGDLEVFRRLRTQVDALLVGTAHARHRALRARRQRPELRAEREALGLAPEPLIATVSRSGELPLDAPLFAEPAANVVVFTTPDAPEPTCTARVALVAARPRRADADERAAPPARRARRALAAVRGRADADGRAAARAARRRAVPDARAAARRRRHRADDEQRPGARRPGRAGADLGARARRLAATCATRFARSTRCRGSRRACSLRADEDRLRLRPCRRAARDVVLAALAEGGHELVDAGAYDDYPVCRGRRRARPGGRRRARDARLRIRRGRRGRGRKLPGVRAATVHDTYTAHQGVEHDDLQRALPRRARHRPGARARARAHVRRARVQRRGAPRRRLAQIAALERDGLDGLPRQPRSIPTTGDRHP